MQYDKMWIFEFFLIGFLFGSASSYIPTIENELREIKNLDGLWNFKISPNDTNKGFIDKWFEKDIMYLNSLFMPVPSSYNDITLYTEVKNFVGWAWYQRTLTLPKSWWKELEFSKYILKFGSVHYFAKVWINDYFLGDHEGGHLPIEYDITKILQTLQGLKLQSPVRITVAVNNTLNHTTIPQSDFVQHRLPLNKVKDSSEWFPDGYRKQELLFDFFNYAGIHRSVLIAKIPQQSITDILIRTKALKVAYQNINLPEKPIIYEYTLPGAQVSKEFIALANKNGPASLAEVEFVITVDGILEEQLDEFDWTCVLKIIGDPSKSFKTPDYFVQKNIDVKAQENIIKVLVLKQPTVLTTQNLIKSLVFNGTVNIPNPQLWWPYTMKPKLFHDTSYNREDNFTSPGYMYTSKIALLKINKTNKEEKYLVDLYDQPFGIRTVAIKSDSAAAFGEASDLNYANDKLPHVEFLVNGAPFYFRGFGWHEDLPFVGRGHSLPHKLADFYRMQWLGANSFRTSHYPYDESVMDLCDRFGVVVINELPAVGVRYFTPTTLAKHSRMARELLARDKNRPSTFIWSLSNEPRSALKPADDYFKNLAAIFKESDPTRFITAVIYEPPNADLIGKHMDIICVNRYLGWYEHVGELGLIKPQTIANINAYGAGYPNKPIIVTEYGAETIPGYHASPPLVFSEEYQVELLQRHHEAFDEFRHFGKPQTFNDVGRDGYCYTNGFTFENDYHSKSDLPKAEHGNLVGEMIWNFADFQTGQTITRVGGNRKGIFSRADRSPKMGAYTLRKRYNDIANE